MFWAKTLIKSLGGKGLTTVGGEIETLDSSGSPRNVIDDGSGNMSIAGSTLYQGSTAQDASDAIVISPSTRYALVQYGTASIGLSGTPDRWNISADGPDVLIGGGQISLSNPGQAAGAAAPPATSTATISSSTGAPTISGNLGDIYFRTDTPTTADQRIYICTTAGVAGTAVWTGIL